MPKDKAFFIGFLLATSLAFGVPFLVASTSPSTPRYVNSFEECAKAGYHILESHPRQCITPDGRSFTENIGEEPLEVHTDRYAYSVGEAVSIRLVKPVIGEVCIQIIVPLEVIVVRLDEEAANILGGFTVYQERWDVGACGFGAIETRFTPTDKGQFKIIATYQNETATSSFIVNGRESAVRFVEVYILVGEDLARRPPRVGEEFRVEARMRNEGPSIIYYLPTLCDTSLSVDFDPAYVTVDTTRPRCLAPSRPTPLRPGEEAVVSAPESGTAYIAAKIGSTSATVTFSYDPDLDMSSPSQMESVIAFPFTIQDGFDAFSIPGFPLEAIVLGLTVALMALIHRRKRRIDASASYREGETTKMPQELSRSA